MELITAAFSHFFKFIKIEQPWRMEERPMRMAIRTSDADVSDLTPVEWLKARNGGKLPTFPWRKWLVASV
jgi:hypothetical protein